MDFSETIEVKVVDKNEQYSVDSYFFAYFHDLPQADLPYIKIPLHTVIKLTPKAYGCDEERYEFRSTSPVVVTDI